MMEGDDERSTEAFSLLGKVWKSMRATPSELRNDMLMRYQGEWYRILEFHHGSKAQARAFIRARLQRLRTGEEKHIRLRAGQEIELVPGEHRFCDYLYQDGDNLVFLNPETFEEVPFPPERFGEAGQFLKPGIVVEGILAGNQLVSVDIPYSAVLQVQATADTISGEYSSHGQKISVLETGVRVEVPLFISPGDVIKVNTKTGEYIERVQIA
jgi:elongation factor P